MSRSRRAGVILVVAAAALAVAPIDALAQRMGGGARSGSHGGSHRGFHHGGPGGRSFAHRPFGGGFIVFAPPLWYGSDLSDDPGPTYAPAPAYDPAVYGPGVGGTLALAPPAPPTPNTVIRGFNSLMSGGVRLSAMVASRLRRARWFASADGRGSWWKSNGSEKIHQKPSRSHRPTFPK